MGTSRGTGKQSRHYNQYMYRAKYLDRTQKVVAQAQTLFLAMAELAQQRDIPFAVVIIPAREQLRPEDFALDLSPFQRGYELDKPQRIFSEFFRSEGILYLDLLPLLREDGVEEKLYFTIDNHWNRAGNEAAGRRIADFLQASGLTER